MSTERNRDTRCRLDLSWQQKYWWSYW